MALFTLSQFLVLFVTEKSGSEQFSQIAQREKVMLLKFLSCESLCAFVLLKFRSKAVAGLAPNFATLGQAD